MTQVLQTALDEAIKRIRQLQRPEARQAASDLSRIRSSLSSPPSVSPELSELDQALCAALHGLPALIQLAQADEIAQILKLLRRMLLSDRCRIDPDPRRHALTMQLCSHLAQLFGRRSSLLESEAELKKLRVHLPGIIDPGEKELTENHMLLLEAYCRTHEEYISHLQEEIRQLQADLCS